ncbi:hemolysin III family protein [Mangrovimonas sp. CR14]|uniref:PAQR family membrane homeostasis protein TrhA n=1 Tax=Mangrovimonas sp. CR14 TaxID=2706120 RepID=UPI001421A531|nr:hemolysin III family protein [Mangrovimonas sp. CR14]NIK93416.1 hemolysin III family protein [Mangrovimonas sp. CR14]
MRIQSPLEEKFNAYTHGIGALLGIVGLILLIVFDNHKTEYSLFSVIVYGITLIVLFSSSTLYHAVQHESKKHYYRILDHISIYLLIAGTYTPICLITLETSKGWTLFIIEWVIVAIGSILKIFFTGKYEAISLILYLVMGWLVVLDYGFLSEALSYNGLLLLFSGGLFYTVGIVFYAIEKIPYNHVIWHLFVLGGALSHYLMILLYAI